ncbi:MAG: hypothetical protein L6U99_06950 [Clostridium sp.]|nr:MAG: hypothetical protein L6U99_06950 [Clostridium sp.]
MVIFALTLDQTGTQSLYETYNDIPLTTMSNKHWFYKEKKEIRKKLMSMVNIICYII